MSQITTGTIDEQSVFALIRLIADPASFKASLEEHAALRNEHVKAASAAREAASALEKVRTDNAAIIQEIAEREATLKQEREALDVAHKALNDRANEVATLEEHYAATVANHAKEIAEKRDGLDRARALTASLQVQLEQKAKAVEQDLAAREQAVTMREHDIELAEAAYARKAERLRKELEA